MSLGQITPSQHGGAIPEEGKQLKKVVKAKTISLNGNKSMKSPCDKFENKM